MRRTLLLALLAIATAAPAKAFGPQGGTAAVAGVGTASHLSVGVFGLDSFGPAPEELPLQFRVATVGLTFSWQGWSAGVSGGQVTWAIPGILHETLPVASFALSREIAGVAGGKLQMEFTAARSFGDDGTTSDLVRSSLRWSLKF